MRELTFTIEKSLRVGLRREPHTPINTECLYECHNLRPTIVGLAPHLEITLIGSEEAYLLYDTGIYLLASTGVKIIL